MPLAIMLGDGSGTDFGASQRIPMGPCCLACRLTFGVFMPLMPGDLDSGVWFGIPCYMWINSWPMILSRTFRKYDVLKVHWPSILLPTAMNSHAEFYISTDIQTWQ